MKNGLKVILPFLLGMSAMAQEPAHPTQHHQSTMAHHAKMKTSLSAEIVNKMHEPMMQVPFLDGDNLDLNFIANMIPHHQGAVESSKLLLKHSKNQKVRAIAQKIIKDQKAEIAEFEQLIPELQGQKKLYSPKEVTLYNNQAKADMEEMGRLMSEAQLSNKLDRDFLTAMIPHHKGAVDASNEILKYTQNEIVKEIAQRIINIQEKEILEFEKLLKTLR